jgi:hypothetical protein
LNEGVERAPVGVPSAVRRIDDDRQNVARLPVEFDELKRRFEVPEFHFIDLTL